MLAAFLLAQAATPQETPTDWRDIATVGPVTVAVEVKSLRQKGPLRTIDGRRSSTESPRAMVVTFAIDCKALTIGLEGDTRFYEGGKVVSTETPPDHARVQQKPEGSAEMAGIIATTCSLPLAI